MIDRNKICIGFKAGQTILHGANDQPDGVYIVYQGLAKITLRGQDGRNFVTQILCEGDLIGHTGAARMSVQVQAVEDTVLCMIRSDDLQRLLEQCPSIRDELIRRYQQEIEVIQSKAHSLVRRSVRERVAGALLQIATAYRIQEPGIRVRINLDRQDIADMAGTTKEQVSALLTEFKRDNLLLLQGKWFEIRGFSALQALSEGRYADLRTLAVSGLEAARTAPPDGPAASGH